MIIFSNHKPVMSILYTDSIMSLCVIIEIKEKRGEWQLLTNKHD